MNRYGAVGRSRRWWTAALVWVFCLASWHAAQATLPAVPSSGVYLGQSSAFTIYANQRSRGSFLARELFRQALLIAARHEMRLPTRDEALGEHPLPDVRRCELSAVGGKSTLLELLQGNAGEERSVWRCEIQFVGTGIEFDYAARIEEIERLSRREFVDALSAAGFRGDDPLAHSEHVAVLPAEIQTPLDTEFTPIAQFLALRKLHSLVATKGESPALLSGLARAYMHLGVLNDHLPHQAAQAFKARGLLYGQRLVAQYPDYAEAIYLRAYTRALAGLHGAALADLKLANSQRARQSPDAPAWAPLIEAYCRFDSPQLEYEKHPAALQPLAALLDFLSAEMEGAPHLVLTRGTHDIVKVPEAYRVIHGLARRAGVGLAHQVTVLGPEMLRETMFTRLAVADDLPAAARTLVRPEKSKPSGGLFGLLLGRESNGDRSVVAQARLLAALENDGLPAAPPPEAGSEPPPSATSNAPLAVATGSTSAPAVAGEPTWPVLGSLLRETAFSQVMMRVYFMRHMWGVPADDFLGEHRPLIRGHRARALVEESPDAPAISNSLPVWEHLRIYAGIHRASRLTETPIWGGQYQRYTNSEMDELPGEIERIYPDKTRSFLTQFPGAMTFGASASPHWPLGMARKWNHFLQPQSAPSPAEKSEFEAFETKVVSTLRRHPALCDLFVRYYELHKNEEKSISWLEALVSSDPSYAHYLALAGFYKKRGNTEQWLTTLEKYLELPDFGLEHARVRVTLSQHFRELGHYHRAAEYAEPAAETWAAWAMQEAALVQEGLLEFDRAELWWDRILERYGHPSCDALSYYGWCLRTGRGKAEAARLQLQPLLDFWIKSKNEANMQRAALWTDIGGDPRQALEIIERIEAPLPYYALQVALLHDALGESPQRDRALEEAVRATSGPLPDNEVERSIAEQCAAVAAYIQADLKAGGKGTLDFDEFRREHFGKLPFQRVYALAMLAQYFVQHENGDKAVPYWKRLLVALPLNDVYRTLATRRLTEHGVKPEEFRELLIRDKPRQPPEREPEFNFQDLLPRAGT